MYTLMYEYDMMCKVFSQYDCRVERLLLPIESMSYIIKYVGLSVKTFFHEYELKSRLNICNLWELIRSTEWI